MGLLFRQSSQALSSLLMFGSALFIFGVAGLVQKREWKLTIDEHRLRWSDGRRRSGEILTDKIKRVRVEDGDGRFLIIETDDRIIHRIPGECYGDAEELRAWFKSNLGKADDIKLI
jgi:hypothetical protein